MSVLLITSYLIFVGFKVCAQSALSGSEEERVKLEILVASKIDSIRTKSNRGILKSDTILYKAAAHHATYISKLGSLTHNETGKAQFKTPQDRVEYFGGTNYLVGENILWVDFNMPLTSTKGKKFNGKDMEDLANAIVTLWKESSPHYKNILNSDYTMSGLAIVFDVKNHRVYACQVFALIYANG